MHSIGEVWAEILWAVSQRLIKKHGYSDDLFPPAPLEDGSVPPGDFYRTDVTGPFFPKHGWGRDSEGIRYVVDIIIITIITLLLLTIFFYLDTILTVLTSNYDKSITQDASDAFRVLVNA